MKSVTENNESRVALQVQFPAVLSVKNTRREILKYCQVLTKRLQYKPSIDSTYSINFSVKRTVVITSNNLMYLAGSLSHVCLSRVTEP